ncbi:hypothetical protein CYLTODRAFT_400697 [Cylindrobasidium torrendii FP15055 ss-10]|uniref:C2H2-type domain-containing protein n=1 Tax=Cylindrobasidium torrendii FP15055 ss-10 TaxID=1314674 RepID=A0A0D7B6W6_9AGAR|nr:hypothetical protein CYLTODRAFT_400697 [Cylindrobasidium torrendii FP15055 ss-10]
MPRLQSFTCTICQRVCRSQGGLQQHRNAVHREVTQEPDSDSDEDEGQSRRFTYRRHPKATGRPCDEFGNFLDDFSGPPPPPPASFEPFDNRASFDFAHFHFVDQKDSASATDRAINMQAALLASHGVDPSSTQWDSANDMHNTIDEINIGAVEWHAVHLRYTGPLPPNPPKWMTDEYELLLRDSLQVLRLQLACPEFDGHIHYSPYQQFNSKGQRVFSNLMSGTWPWKQCDIITQNAALEGVSFMPVVAGSDKTTVSVATGHQTFHPVYQGLGNLDNLARRAHGQGIIPTAFLPIPKVPKEVQNTKEFQTFTRQLYHACLARIFEPLRPGMTTPEIVQCPDRHYRQAIFGIGPYIADYPEQVLLSCVVSNWCPKCTAKPDVLDDDPDAILRTHQTSKFLIENFDPGIIWSDFGVRSDPFTVNFPRANIHELLSPDLLHQVIKGTFKDHLVEWVNDWLELEHGETAAQKIIKDIDRRISAVPVFPGLRRFPDGRNFSQWTGNDSKALMKVYLAAIAGYVPGAMLRALSAFIDFCYLVRRNAIDTDALSQIQKKLDEFHHYRRIFIDTGVRDTISLPRQHSLTHYPRSIVLFGSPNGLCSSITESKHIRAVKQPWRQSNRNKPLYQMVQRISRMDKMAAKSSELREAGCLVGTTLSYTVDSMRDGFTPTRLRVTDDEDNDEDDENLDLGPAFGPKTFTTIALASTPARHYPRSLAALAEHIRQPQLPKALRQYTFELMYPDHDIPDELSDLPVIMGGISVFHSAVAKFYAPSDTCGAGGMYRERIRSTPLWQNEYERRDTVFVVTDADAPQMDGMHVARVLLFFSFMHNGEYHPCALVHWLLPEQLDADTGYHVVRWEEVDGQRPVQVIGLDAIARGAHLLPIYGSEPLPEYFHYSNALDAFKAFYVNRHADYHVHEFI